jgi:hypothetical protein
MGERGGKKGRTITFGERVQIFNLEGEAVRYEPAQQCCNVM